VKKLTFILTSTTIYSPDRRHLLQSLTKLNMLNNVIPTNKEIQSSYIMLCILILAVTIKIYVLNKYFRIFV
jgi:hypothetical protein